jgi:hypothetical protein
MFGTCGQFDNEAQFFTRIGLARFMSSPTGYGSPLLDGTVVIFAADEVDYGLEIARSVVLVVIIASPTSDFPRAVQGAGVL